MSSFSSLSMAVSGMQAAQLNLSVISHNLANVGTDGYSRQDVIQSDFAYLNTGVGQIGLGTNVEEIRQIRDEFLDISYRAEASKQTYYGPLVATGEQIESLLGELKDDTGTQSVMQDMWDALNELVLEPDSLDSRGTFVSTAVTFVNQMQIVYEGLEDYQKNLNQEVKTTVDQINYYVSEVDKYNELIAKEEANGSNANDYRDTRNYALDQLSQLTSITYTEKTDGTIDILLEGKELLSNGMQNTIGLKYVEAGSSLVEPVFTTQSTSDILPADSNALQVYDLRGTIDIEDGENSGYLKGILVARGNSSVTYTSEEELRANEPDPSDPAYPLGEDDPAYKADYKKWEQDIFSIEQSTIPQFMAQLDTLFNSVVTMINDAVAPQNTDAEGPYGIDDDQSQFLEIFTRDDVPRYVNVDGVGEIGPGDYFVGEDGIMYDDAGNPHGSYIGSSYDTGGVGEDDLLYSISNTNVNELFLDPDNYDKIPLSASGDVSDTTVPEEILAMWKEGIVELPTEGDGYTDGMGVEAAYNYIVSESATNTAEAQSFLDAQGILVLQIDSQRETVKGVSLDEEMTKMTQYQYSYQASAQLVTTIDEMLDTLINNTAV